MDDALNGQVSEHADYFAQVVKQRIQHLRLSLAGVQRAKGPSVPIVSAITRGKWDTPSSLTFEKLDTALQWEPGSAARAYWERVEPVSVSPLDDGGDADEEESDVRTQLERLLAANPTVHVAARRLADVPDMSEQEMRTIVDLLDMFVSKRNSRGGRDVGD